MTTKITEKHIENNLFVILNGTHILYKFIIVSIMFEPKTEILKRH